MKKSISIILALLMLAGIFTALPLTASAVTVIDNIVITGVGEPVEGGNPSFNASLGGHYVTKDNEKVWFNLTDSKEMSASDVFEAGKEYSFVVFLTPEEGYEFKTKTNDVYEPDVTVTVNGKDAYVYYVTGHKSSEYIEIAYAFTVGAATIIDNIAITGVTEPVVGAHPVESAVVPAGTVLDDCGWYDKTGGDWISTSDVFQSGHIYQVKAYLSAAVGYAFDVTDDKPDVSVTINGRVAKVNKVNGLDANKGLVATVTYGEYTVKFDANGGSGNMADDPEQNGGYILPECEFTAPEDAEFDGWAVNSPSGKKYAAGYEYDVTEDVVFYATWKTTTIAAHEHEWSEWTVTKRATPDEDGEETRECLENPAHTETRPIPAVSSITINKYKFTYNGKVQKPTFTVKDANGKKLVEGVDYDIINPANAKNVGLYLISVLFTGDRYEGLYDADFSIAQAKNPMVVKGLTKSVKAATVKKKNVTVAALSVSKAQGTKSFSKTSGNKKITVNKTTGKFTVKKGLKKGTYKVKVKVTAKGNKNYKSLSKTVTATIKVK